MNSIFQKKALIVSAVFFLFSCLAFLFIYRVVEFRNESSLEKEANWQAEEVKKNNLKILARLMKDTEIERAEIESHFVRSSEASAFLDGIENLARKSDVSLEIASVNTEKSGAYMTVALKTSGTFSAIYKFINLLENSPYILSFNSINLSKDTVGESVSSKDKKDPEWSATLEVKLLSFINE